MSTATPAPAVKLAKRPRIAQRVPEACPACDANETFVVEDAVGSFPYRDEEYKVSYQNLTCPACGFTVLGDGQLEARNRSLVTAYQRRHGFLTAEEVQAKRKALGYPTQQAFADAATGVALATLKRVESGAHGQDAGTDIVLRTAFESLEVQNRQTAIERLRQAKLSQPTQVHVTITSVVSRYSGWSELIPWAVAASAVVSCGDLLSSSRPLSPAPAPLIREYSGC